MRFYAKLLLLIALFAWLSSAAGRETAADLAYDLRVKFVLAFGTPADYEALVDDTQRALAERNGRGDVYRAGKRFRELFEQRLAEAKRRHVVLSEEEIERVRSECAREAFGAAAARETAYAGRAGDGAEAD